jgi:hypothetical protein
MAGDLKLSLEGIGGLLGSVGTAAKDLRAAITGKSILDPAKEAELEMKLAEIEQKAQEAENALALAQSQVNLEEAKSTNFFISGGRPLFFWIGGAVIIFVYIIGPILKACSVPLPDISMGDLWPVVTGILGLGTMRSYEKSKGVVGQH